MSERTLVMERVGTDAVPPLICQQCHRVVRPRCYVYSDGENRFDFSHLCRRWITADEIAKFQKYKESQKRKQKEPKL